MKAVIAAAVLFTALSAGAWDRVYEGTGVTRFAERGDRLWALPGISSSSDHGRAWSAALEAGDWDDLDISEDLRKASIDRLNYLHVNTLDNASLIPVDAPSLAAWRVRFIGKVLMVVGSSRDASVVEEESIQLSRDSGATWSTALPGKVSALADLFVLDERRAWIVDEGGDSVVVWRTVDGGKNWARAISVPPIFGSCDDMHFIDKKRGWLAMASGGAKSVYATEDGGETWEQRGPIFVSTAGALSLSFAGKKEGWAAARGALWKTADGGKTWTPQALPTQAVPDAVALHYGEEKGRGYLLYGTSTEEPDAEDERAVRLRGEIHRMEVDKP